MKIFIQIVISLFLTISMVSCYVVQPKHTSVEKVITIKPGMTLQTVNETLNLQPYDIYQRDTLGNYTYVYKYRLTDVKRIPVLMKKNKGITTEGGFKNLLVTYNHLDQVVLVNSTYETIESDLQRRKVNITAIITSLTTIITVTVPSVLLFITRKP